MRLSRRKLLHNAGGLIGASALGLSQSAFANDTTEYFYDPLGRLIRVELSDGTVIVYDYDRAGNRTRVVHGDDVPFNQTLQITGTGPVNLRTLADQAGYLGVTDATITFQLGSAVTITGATGGGIGIDTGVWPSATKAISLTLQISGKVYGGGGTGGTSAEPPNSAGAGGDAIYCRENMALAVNVGGQVRAGGGGGGYGGGWQWSFRDGEGQWENAFKAGGSGGGGFPNGTGANPGTTSGGGAGGAGQGGGGHPSGAGGSGGGAATAGSAGGAATGSVGCNFANTICWNATTPPGTGGAAGYAVRKNGKTVNVTNNGTISGTVG